MKKKRIVNISIHVIIWSVFLLLPIFIVPSISEIIVADTYQFFTYIFVSSVSILFFYFNYYVAMPLLFFKNKYWGFFLSIIGFIVGVGLLIIVLYYFFNQIIPISEYDRNLIRNYLLRFIIILIISFLFGYKKRNKEIESERVKTELSALKSQINPHFLFNTLNGIYGQALIKSDQTADSIFKLSAMMRYVLTEATEEKVPLQDEINYLNSYLQLQNMRLTNKTKVDFVVNGNIESKMIAPLLFINFIENAFKYGVSNEVSSIIDISFDIKEDFVLFVVKNDVVNPNSNMESTKLGIKNTTRRLDLIYPNQYVLKFNKSKTNFEVHLKISDV